jgi:nitroreductase
METQDAIRTRRSVRAFTQEPVTEADLQTLLQALTASASAGNVQPWAFVVVREPRRLAALRALAPGIIGRPTAAIAICLDAGRAQRLGGPLGDRLAWIDIGLATQNLLLAAHDGGLGACPIGSFHPGAVALFLELPPQVQPILLVALGHPAQRPSPRDRRPLGEVAFTERWGQAYE